MDYKPFFNFSKFNYSLIAGLFLITVLFPLLFNDKIIRLFHDDSFFYMKTAYNNSIGIFSSFDTVNKTSGYHPLYMALLSGVSFFLPLSGQHGIIAVFALDMLMFSVFSLFIVKIMDKLKLNIFSKLITILLLVCSLAFNDFGIEVRLLLPLYWLLILLLLKNYRNYLILGAISALIFFTRIDSIIFVFFIVIFLLLESTPFDKKKVKNILFFLSPIIFLFFSYTLFNWLYFGHISSVSSWLKFGFKGVGYPIVHGFLGVRARFLLCILPALVFLIYFSKNIFYKKYTPESLLFFLMNLSNLAFLLVISNLSRGGLASWYFALSISISIVTSVYLFKIFFGDKVNSVRLIKLLQVSFILILAVALLIFLNRKLNYHYQDDAVSISRWINENFDKNKNIFQVDNSGFTGYLSNRNIINGDGLINSWEYQVYLRNDDLVGYFKKYSVNYIIWDKYNSENEIKIPVMLWDKPDEYLALHDYKIIKRSGRFVLLEFDYNKIKLLK